MGPPGLKLADGSLNWVMTRAQAQKNRGGPRADFSIDPLECHQGPQRMYCVATFIRMSGTGQNTLQREIISFCSDSKIGIAGTLLRE